MISQSNVSSTGNVPAPDRVGTVRRFFSALKPMRRDLNVRYGISGALLAAALWTGCEDPGTGTLDPRGNAPFLSSAVVSPNSINLGSLPSGPSGLIATTTATVHLTDPDPGGVVTAVVEVYTPDDTPVASAPLLDDGVTPDRAAGDGVFTARVQFTVTESDAGRCRVRLSAVDELGLRSNALEVPLVLSRPKPNSPPVLSDLRARHGDAALDWIRSDYDDGRSHGPRWLFGHPRRVLQEPRCTHQPKPPVLPKR